MSRNRRAALLAVAAVAAAGLGVILVSGYSTSVSQGYGDLRSVVVVSGPLEGGRRLTAAMVRRKTEVRQVPDRFVPAGALADPAAAIGLAATGPLISGSYLTTGVLRRPASEAPARPRLAGGRVPVELTVSGAAALSEAGPAVGGASRVDVLVTRESAIGGRGSTRLAARGVPLIAVGGEDPAAAAGLSKVILGLTRSQAIKLIDAEAFARRLTVLPGGPR